MAGTVSIYAISDVSGPRYVGQTVQPLKERFSSHHVPEQLRREGATPRIELLEVSDTDSANAAEARWIAELSAAGHRLLNRAPGGRCAPREATKIVMLRISVDFWNSLDGMARREESSVAGVLRRLARERLEQLEQQG